MRGKGRELSFRAQVGIAFVAASIAAVSVLAFSAAGLAAAVPSLTTTGTTLFTNGEPNPTGVATARCVNGGTLYTLHFSGLNQKAVYTVWGITFTDGPNGSRSDRWAVPMEARTSSALRPRERRSSACWYRQVGRRRSACWASMSAIPGPGPLA